MPAAAWTDLLVDSDRLTALCTDLPPLRQLPLRSVHLSPYGAGVKLRVDLPRFPDLAPAAWTEAGCDRLELQLEFTAVAEDLHMRGTPDGTAVDLALATLPRIREPRISVAVTGTAIRLSFTAYAAIKAVHLNAYRSTDPDPATAPRWFVSPFDQRLHRAQPPVTSKAFHG
ncbi:hypothetical protein [Streptomyces sp. NRRL WC-3742]|uniref:hypothetical protein n=1 Tax=Streptomyces sp. NRRL WC-3742 TaxID=1463934 RepID=UPI0004CA035D|nr:hypothetical protein [Streptomyces sp. NRRL WC-3742]